MDAQRWWQDRGKIPVLVAGVFEGGGAKGIAYAGALKAMKETGCWFTAVAGASAGAITAALVAAGLEPDEIEEETSRGLLSLSGGLLRGLRRLAPSGAYYDSAELHRWLERILACQVTGLSGVQASSEGVTFVELFAATGIELNVVAADLTLRRQIVFSHLDTPHCQVAQAVLASSAIPFAFGSGALAMTCSDDPAPGRRHHLIVDGGVWANYPDFVFRDPSFRLSQGRPARPEEELVIGFLLRVGDDAAERKLRELMRDARFEPLQTATPCALELHRPGAPVDPAGRPDRGVLIGLLGIVLSTGTLLSRLIMLLASVFSVFVGTVGTDSRGGLGQALDEVLDAWARLRGKTRAVHGAIPKRNLEERLWWAQPLTRGRALMVDAAGTALSSMQFPLVGGLLWVVLFCFISPSVVNLLVDAAAQAVMFEQVHFWPRVGEVLAEFLGMLLVAGLASFALLFLIFLAELITANCLLYVGFRRLGMPLAVTYSPAPGRRHGREGRRTSTWSGSPCRRRWTRSASPYTSGCGSR